MSDSESDDEYGPVLPPGFGNKEKEDDSSSSDGGLGLKGSGSHVIGPALPSGFGNRFDKGDNSAENDSDGNNVGLASCVTDQRPNIIGPVLPPGLGGGNSKGDNSDDSDSADNVIGPALPPGFVKKTKSIDTVYKSQNCIGPSLPPGFLSSKTKVDTELSDDDLNTIGPLPSEKLRDGDEKSAAIEFEARAQRMRDKLNAKTDEDSGAVQRDSWMMELPPEIGQNFGLSSRQFRTRDKPELGDRSMWTDTPADRERKMKEMAEGKGDKRKRDDKYCGESEKEKTLKDQIASYNKSERAESLLDMHKKKIKEKNKEKDKKNEPKERREFDREADLQVNQLDDAKKRAIVKRSQELNTRFKSGGTGTSFL